MIRTHLVKSLYANLVGPINGPTETVEQPYTKYQVGILESCFHSNDEQSAVTGTQELLEEKIIKVISSNPEFTRNQIAEKLKVSSETIKEYLAKLKNKGKLKRIGGRKTGQWEIIK